ncbi:hypothetical protein NDU88_003831 [Pleurodeles waltl]|uniref:Uncharacterized protein n=1 Tax=Pleurodeles waltl TaxID=8319 RepID=A0AAV7NLS7_PLEWA|nr:hypothetical protein NDU88_003831 [Pleurodeles waltl]
MGLVESYNEDEMHVPRNTLPSVINMSCSWGRPPDQSFSSSLVIGTLNRSELSSRANTITRYKPEADRSEAKLPRDQVDCGKHRFTEQRGA